ncbi:MAG: hypothetical protein COV67_12225 [Nitrospinae bacterium CG11_big_fil_rev_8_21_14_0_20_56_8]|nr:MAG: hypothetical protein COV67_12225 [Nitrospinae bacterium CG11_big_fil_rev_8_21_14_0_20_56_8]
MKKSGLIQTAMQDLTVQIHRLGREMEGISESLSHGRRNGKLTYGETEELRAKINAIYEERRILLIKQKQFGRLIPEWWQ